MYWKSLSFNCKNHNHAEKKKGNVPSDWRQIFPIKQSHTMWLQQIQGLSMCTHHRKNCQQLNHHVGSYATRSMINSVPARVSSQLQRYPYNTDKAITADHNTFEQELTIDNKAMLRPMGKCRMSRRDPQKQEQVLHKAHSSWHTGEPTTAGKHNLWT